MQPAIPSRSRLSARLRAAVAALPEVFREVVVFRYFEDMSVPEIAQVLGVPEGSVKSRLNRAKLRIRALLRVEE